MYSTCTLFSFGTLVCNQVRTEGVNKYVIYFRLIYIGVTFNKNKMFNRVKKSKRIYMVKLFLSTGELYWSLGKYFYIM